MIYVATFYTHAAALLTYRALTKNGFSAVLQPVPRSLSSSCGTCVRFEAPDPCYALLDRDVEQVAETAESGYRVIRTYD